MDLSSEKYSTSFKNKMLVLKALEQLLDEKPLEKISVKEICARAHLSRSMFYTYFDNKISIIEWYLEFAIGEGVGKIGINCGWLEGHLATTKAFADYHRVFRTVLNSEEGEGLTKTFHSFRRAAMTNALKARGIKMTPKLGFQIDALVAGGLEANKRWYEELSFEEMAEFMVSITPPDLYEALEKPINPKRLGD